MALGGPASLEEVEPYLREVRGGRETPPALLEEFRERYRHIGGRSPLLERSIAQARGLEALLRLEGEDVRVFVGMRHWHPFIVETLRTIREQGREHVVALCLTPYRSRKSVGAYFAALKEAREGLSFPRTLVEVPGWNEVPALVEAFAAKVAEGRERLASAGYPDPFVLFTAHSLPAQIRAEGDPYESDLLRTMELVLAQLPPMRSRLAYQSAGRTRDPWIGPPVPQVLSELARAGERAVLIVPFGFLSDNLEVLYDVDVEFQKLALEEGLRLERTSSLNDDPKLVEALAQVVRPYIRSDRSPPSAG
jgi:ferrochelatase